MRFLTPALFAAAAAYVAWYNGAHTDRALVLPFIEELFPSTAGSPSAQGSVTVTVLAALAGIFAIWDTVVVLRQRKSRE